MLCHHCNNNLNLKYNYYVKLEQRSERQYINNRYKYYLSVGTKVDNKHTSGDTFSVICITLTFLFISNYVIKHNSTWYILNVIMMVLSLFRSF